jgi:hypothetical protein
MKYTEYSDMGIEKLEIVKQCLDMSPLGLCLEIGTRKGGTALMTLEHENCQGLISVDPYGAKPYTDKNGIAPFIYPDQWYAETMVLLMQASLELNKLFVQFKITSQEYMKHNIEIWLEGKPNKTHNLKYSYVLLDGEHNDTTVQQEIDFFSKKMGKGGVLLVDNVDWLTLSLPESEGWQKPRQDMAYKIFN